MHRHTYITLSAAFLLLFFTARSIANGQAIRWNAPNKWVDSVFATLSEDQRITQLMMIAAYTTKEQINVADVECHVRELDVGGLIFFKGNPYKQALLTNQYQALSKVPLLIGIDGEWGLSMRLDSVPTFPRQMVFGAANDLSLTRDFGRAVGLQCRRMGIHFNFAPDVDVNNNMANPVINDRSFGENKNIVAKHGLAYALGMQDLNVLASAKHFPGHGDTENDSHYGLPVIKGNRKRLDSLELYPFRELIKNDVAAVMTAHLNVPALDTTPNLASSLSPAIITRLLKEEMGFEGIVITDALNMKAVSNFFGPGEVAAKALAAGNDMLLLVDDVPMSIAVIKDYVKRNLISWEQINRSCKKILLAKYWCGLNKYQPIKLENITKDLNNRSSELLIRKVIKEGIVVARDMDNLIPLENPEQYKIASVNVGVPQLSVFQQTLRNYLNCDFFAIDKNESQQYFDSLLNQMDYYNLIIISLHGTSRFVSKSLGLTKQQIAFINSLMQRRKTILVNHGNSYILQHFQNCRNAIVAYEDLPEYNLQAAQLLCGGYGARGKLPVSVKDAFPLGSGILTASLPRFEYVYAEEAETDSDKLQKIDSIVSNALLKKAFPGCQVLVAKDGKVIYNKSFGYHTYDSLKPVMNHHAYDLASLTKILSTTLAVMMLYEEKKISLEDRIGFYLPVLSGSNKEKIKIKDILTHQAGLVPFIPFYKNTLVNGRLNPIIYSDSMYGEYNIPVANGIWMNRLYEKEIWKTIAHSRIDTPGKYVYSDLGFMLLRKLVETVTNTEFERYVSEQFYKPLNLGGMVFNPIHKINNDWIVPTEQDTVFRKQLLKGYVHDPAAAMLGGVSGHAGLFANANDVAVVMQMLLNGGYYGNARILKSSTISYFTKKFSKTSRRGLGFDKPETGKDPVTQKIKDGPTSNKCSPQTFGHTGFTGTCAWADPENGIVYVFLSNRVYPSTENKKLVELSVRTAIQDVIYEAVK